MTVSPLTLPIARLRASGAKVSPLIEHDPKHGTWAYIVTLPAEVGASEFTDIAQDAQAGVSVTVARDSDNTQVIYQKFRRRADTEVDWIARAERVLAERLASAAGYLEERERQIDRSRRMTWSGGKR